MENVMNNDCMNIIREGRKEVSDTLNKYSDSIVLYMYSRGCENDGYVTIRLDLGLPLVDIYDSREDGFFDSKEKFKDYLLDRVKYEINKFAQEINSIELD